MSIKNNDIFKIAEELSQGSSEVYWRTSASRSYYAAYHLAKDVSSVCPDNAHFVIASGTHGKLIDRFSLWTSSDRDKHLLGKQVAYILKDMKRSREIADYELGSPFPQETAHVKLKQVPILQRTLASIWNLSDQHISG